MITLPLYLLFGYTQVLFRHLEHWLKRAHCLERLHCQSFSSLKLQPHQQTQSKTTVFRTGKNCPQKRNFPYSLYLCPCVCGDTRVCMGRVLFFRHCPLLGRGETERSKRRGRESDSLSWSLPTRPDSLAGKPRDPPAFASPVLGAQACATRLCKWALG